MHALRITLGNTPSAIHGIVAVVTSKQRVVLKNIQYEFGEAIKKSNTKNDKSYIVEFLDKYDVRNIMDGTLLKDLLTDEPDEYRFPIWMAYTKGNLTSSSIISISEIDANFNNNIGFRMKINKEETSDEN